MWLTALHPIRLSGTRIAAGEVFEADDEIGQDLKRSKSAAAARAPEPEPEDEEEDEDDDTGGEPDPPPPPPAAQPDPGAPPPPGQPDASGTGTEEPPKTPAGPKPKAQSRAPRKTPAAT